MEHPGKREHSRSLRRLYQPGRPESDAAGPGQSRHQLREPLQLLGGRRELHLVCTGGGKAEHDESDVSGGELHQKLQFSDSNSKSDRESFSHERHCGGHGHHQRHGHTAIGRF